jgi:hypothetical protein
MQIQNLLNLGWFKHVDIKTLDNNKVKGWKYPWVVSLGTTLPKSQESWTQFKK